MILKLRFSKTKKLRDYHRNYYLLSISKTTLLNKVSPGETKTKIKPRGNLRSNQRPLIQSTVALTTNSIIIKTKREHFHNYNKIIIARITIIALCLRTKTKKARAQVSLLKYHLKYRDKVEGNV